MKPADVLAEYAKKAADDSDPTAGVLLALEAELYNAARPEKVHESPARISLEHAFRNLREIAILKGEPGLISGVAVTPGGRRAVSWVREGAARVWDLSGGEALAVFEGSEPEIGNAAISPDGARVATSSTGGLVQLWDVNGKALLKSFNTGAGPAGAVAFSADGKEIAASGSDGTVHRWNIQSGAETAQIAGQGGNVAIIAAKGRVERTIKQSAISYDDTFWITDTAGGSGKAAMVKASGGRIASMARTPDERFIVTGSGQLVQLWDGRTGAGLAAFKGLASSVKPVAISADGKRVAAGAMGGEIRLWDTQSGALLAVLKGHQKDVTSLAMSADGGIVWSASDDRTLRVWRGDTSGQGRVLARNNETIGGIAVTRDGSRVVTATAAISDPMLVKLGIREKSEPEARIWDIRTGALLMALKGHSGPVTCVAVTPNGKEIVTGSGDNTVKIWNANTGALRTTLTGHKRAVRAVAVSPDGSRIFSGSEDGQISMWDSSTGAVIVAGSIQVPVTSLAALPDNNRVVAGTKAPVAVIVDMRGGAKPAVLAGHGMDVTSVAVTPDGTRVLTGAWDGTVHVWDANTGSALAVYKAGSMVSSVAVTSDGRKIITGSGDGSVGVWDASTGAALARLKGETPGFSDIVAIAVTPDGRGVVSASRGNTIQYWELGLSGDELVKEARARVPRCLTPAQREQYHLKPAIPSWCYALNKWPYDADSLIDEVLKAYELTFDVIFGPAAAQVQQQEGKVKAAFETVLRLHPSAARKIQQRWADALIGRGLLARDAAAAQADFAEALKHDPSAGPRSMRRRVHLLIRRAAMQLSDRKDDAAKAGFDEALKLDPSVAGEIEREWGQAFLRRAQEQLNSGRNDKAEALFAEALKHDASLGPSIAKAKASSLVLRGNKLLREGKDSEAEAPFASAVQLDPAAASSADEAWANELIFRRGAKMLKDGDTAGAERAFGEALRRNPLATRMLEGQKRSILTEKAKQLLEAGKEAEADRAYTEAGPGILSDAIALCSALHLRISMAGRLAADGKLSEAKAKLYDVLALYPAATLHINRSLAASAFARGDYAEAIGQQLKVTGELENIFKIANSTSCGEDRPETADLRTLAWYRLLNKEFEAAEYSATQAALRGPTTPINFANVAHALMFEGKAEEARALYLKYKGMPGGEKAGSWDEEVVKAFAEFEKRGMTHPQMAEIRALLVAGK